MLKVGIVGLGAISSTQIEAISRLSDMAEIKALCDCDSSKKVNIENTNFYTDVEEMLKKENLDCLHICLPHYLHKPTTILAAKYGVNVFMEKPAGINSEEITEMEKIVNDSGIKVGICFQNRFNATTQKAQEIIRSGKYGKVKGCKAIVTWDRRENYYTKDLWRGKKDKAGGGVMITQAIHSLDLMKLFCGDIEWVKGLTGNLLLENIEVEDTACAYIQFKNGIGGIFYGTVTHCFNSSVEIEIVLEKGVLQIKNNKLTYIDSDGETIFAKDNPDTMVVEGEYQTMNLFYRKLMNLEGGDYISLEEAKQDNILIEKIAQSAQEKRKVYWNDVS